MSLIYKTDQIECYDTEGVVVDCAGSGQDGETDAGRRWPSPRFDINPLTVVDRLSGLMWTRDASPGEFPLTWHEAFEFIESMNGESICGHSDWRLPNRSELFGLVSHAHVNPALPRPSPFENVFHGYYWTSSGCSGLENQAWYVHLGGGRVFRGMKHGSYMVWPVRHRSGQAGGSGAAGGLGIDASNIENDAQQNAAGQQSFQSARRFSIDDGTFVDRLTGLEWLPNAGGSNAALSWPQALEKVDALNSSAGGERNDWRLPNVRELESLVDTGHHSPAFGIGLPFVSLPGGCWSSTTSVYEPRYAWVVYTKDGAVGVGFKKGATFSCWAVRGG